MDGCLLQESEVALKKTDNEGEIGSKQTAFHIAFSALLLPSFLDSILSRFLICNFISLSLYSPLPSLQ